MLSALGKALASGLGPSAHTGLHCFQLEQKLQRLAQKQAHEHGHQEGRGSGQDLQPVSKLCERTFMRMVQEVGFFTSSTKVYFSSPSTCSYTLPAYPRDSGTSSST